MYDVTLMYDINQKGFLSSKYKPTRKSILKKKTRVSFVSSRVSR